MHHYKLIVATIIIVVFGFACQKENNIDTQKPEITIEITGAFPQNCDTLFFGETFSFKSLFSDNVELGSFNISIHDNFDHHSHTTETELIECIRDMPKVGINPFIFIQDYEIPEGLTQFEPNLQIELPSSNNKGKLEEGDYHFVIRLTDKEGWSAYKGLSIKMLHK